MATVAAPPEPAAGPVAETPAVPRHQVIAFVVMVALLVVAPFFVYPVFLMKALCFALFACAFNLLIGYVGLLSFGHAAFLGGAGYASAHAAKVWGFPPASPSAPWPSAAAASTSRTSRWPSRR
jgi:branched-chain amino acid transport system permease protein